MLLWPPQWQDHGMSIDCTAWLTVAILLGCGVVGQKGDATYARKHMKAAPNIACALA